MAINEQCRPRLYLYTSHRQGFSLWGSQRTDNMGVGHPGEVRLTLTVTMTAATATAIEAQHFLWTCHTSSVETQKGCS